MRRRGFTIIELLVFSAIFSIIMIGLITVFVVTTRVQSRQSSANEVETQGQFLLQQLQYYIQTARLVNIPQDAATGTLTLAETVASSSLDPTVINLSSGTVYLTQGTGGTAQALTSNKVTVSNLSFTRHYNISGSSTVYGADSVSYSFTVAANNTNGTQKYSQFFQSSASVFAPVPKIALVQQASTYGITTTTRMTLSPASNNATGSLLLAVVANTNLASIAITDTASNTWSNVVSTTYPAYNLEVGIFAALNAKNSSNTVTANFGGSGGYNPSLYLFEYRGAATSSSFDASSTQTQSNTTSPSSGLASSTSGVELVFGTMILSAAPASPPTGGSGFTAEASSTVSISYSEDKNLYVTGPVSAGWTLGQAGNALTTVVTFK